MILGIQVKNRKAISEILGSFIALLVIVSTLSAYMVIIEKKQQSIMSELELKNRKMKIENAEITIEPFITENNTLGLKILSPIKLHIILMMIETADGKTITFNSTLVIDPSKPQLVMLPFKYNCEKIKIILVDSSGAIIKNPKNGYLTCKLNNKTISLYDPITNRYSFVMESETSPIIVFSDTNRRTSNISLIIPSQRLSKNQAEIDVYVEDSYLGRIQGTGKLKLFETPNYTAFINIEITNLATLIYLSFESNAQITMISGELNATLNLRAVYNDYQTTPRGDLNDTTLVLPYAYLTEGFFNYTFTRKLVTGSLIYTRFTITETAHANFTAYNKILILYASQEKAFRGTITLELAINNAKGMNYEMKKFPLGEIIGKTEISVVSAQPIISDIPTQLAYDIINTSRLYTLELEAITGNMTRGIWDLLEDNSIRIVSSENTNLQLRASIPLKPVLNQIYLVDKEIESTSTTYTVKINASTITYPKPLPWLMPILIQLQNNNTMIEVQVIFKESNLSLNKTQHKMNPIDTVFPNDEIIIQEPSIILDALLDPYVKYEFSIITEESNSEIAYGIMSIQELLDISQSNVIILYPLSGNTTATILIVNG